MGDVGTGTDWALRGIGLLLIASALIKAGEAEWYAWWGVIFLTYGTVASEAGATVFLCFEACIGLMLVLNPRFVLARLLFLQLAFGFALFSTLFDFASCRCFPSIVGEVSGVLGLGIRVFLVVVAMLAAILSMRQVWNAPTERRVRIGAAVGLSAALLAAQVVGFLHMDSRSQSLGACIKIARITKQTEGRVSGIKWQLTNVCSEPLEIVRFKSSCSCNVVRPNGSLIPAGGSISVEAFGIKPDSDDSGFMVLVGLAGQGQIGYMMLK